MNIKEAAALENIFDPFNVFVQNVSIRTLEYY